MWSWWGLGGASNPSPPKEHSACSLCPSLPPAAAATKPLPTVCIHRGFGRQDVGFISGVQGLTQVALAIPIGMISDKFQRQSMLRCGAVVGFVAVSLTAIVFTR